MHSNPPVSLFFLFEEITLAVSVNTAFTNFFVTGVEYYMLGLMFIYISQGL